MDAVPDSRSSYATKQENPAVQRSGVYLTEA